MITKQSLLRRINEAKTTVTDREVFFNDTFRSMLLSIIKGICKEYNVKITMVLEWLTERDYVAKTNGNTYWLNLNNCFTQAPNAPFS